MTTDDILLALNKNYYYISKTSPIFAETIGGFISCEGCYASVNPGSCITGLLEEKLKKIYIKSSPKRKKERQKFIEKLNYYENRLDMTDYKLAKECEMDQSVLTTIRGCVNTHYVPKKITMLLICIVLNLSYLETSEFLALSGNPIEYGNYCEEDAVVLYYIKEREKVPEDERVSGKEQIRALDDFFFEKTKKTYLVKRK